MSAFRFSLMYNISNPMNQTLYLQVSASQAKAAVVLNWKQ